MDASLGVGHLVRTRRPLRERWRLVRHALHSGLKLAMMRALARLMRPRGVRAAPVWSARAHRVLYLRYDRIGDMVLASGVIRGIRAAQPTVTVDVLASSQNADVLLGNPDIGTVFIIDKSRPWTFLTALARIRRMRYDAVIDAKVMAPSLTTMLLMWTCGARHRIGARGRGNDDALTLPVPRIEGAVHYLDHSAALLEAFGAPPSSLRPQLILTADELRKAESRWGWAESSVAGGHGPKRRLVINVSAGDRWCYWPEERFIAALLRTRACFPSVRMLVVGSPEDDVRMVRIGSGAGVPVAHTEHYREMMAIVAASDLVLTADATVTHVASAFAKPVLAMFPRGGGAVYGPYRTASWIVSTSGPSLASLELEQVVRGLEEMIAAASRAPSARIAHTREALAYAPRAAARPVRVSRTRVARPHGRVTASARASILCTRTRSSRSTCAGAPPSASRRCPARSLDRTPAHP